VFIDATKDSKVEIKIQYEVNKRTSGWSLAQNGEKNLLDCVVVRLVQCGCILVATVAALYIVERVEMLRPRVTSGRRSQRVCGMQVVQNGLHNITYYYVTVILKPNMSCSVQ